MVDLVNISEKKLINKWIIASCHLFIRYEVYMKIDPVWNFCCRNLMCFLLRWCYMIEDRKEILWAINSNIVYIDESYKILSKDNFLVILSRSVWLKKFQQSKKLCIFPAFLAFLHTYLSVFICYGSLFLFWQVLCSFLILQVAMRFTPTFQISLFLS